MKEIGNLRTISGREIRLKEPVKWISILSKDKVRHDRFALVSILVRRIIMTAMSNRKNIPDLKFRPWQE
jgi:hypothetical protein